MVGVLVFGWLVGGVCLFVFLGLVLAGLFWLWLGVPFGCWVGSVGGLVLLLVVAVCLVGLVGFWCCWVCCCPLLFVLVVGWFVLVVWLLCPAGWGSCGWVVGWCGLAGSWVNVLLVWSAVWPDCLVCLAGLPVWS